MANVLNLALKKDVFEGLQNGTTNKILIGYSRWWRKRLMDLDSGVFKNFDVACVSSGSSDKIDYEIEQIEQLENKDFVVTVKVGFDQGEQPSTDEGDSDFDDETPIQYSDAAVPPIHTVTDGNGEGIEITGIKGTQEDLLKSEVVNPVTVETDENGNVVVKATYVKPISEITQKFILKKTGEMIDDAVNDAEEESPKNPEIKDSENKDIKDIVMNLIDKFCELKDVYVVNMDSVTIRNNGQVFGCKKRLIADRDSDVKFNFVKKEFIKYPNTLNSAFALQVLYYLNNMLKNNYVFINKSACKFREGNQGNIILTIVAIGKRKYFFAK